VAGIEHSGAIIETEPISLEVKNSEVGFYFDEFKQHLLRARFMSSTEKPLVGVIMGSKSDWDVMRAAAETLKKFSVPHECHVMSAHRTPDLVMKYVSGAEGNGLEVLIAAAGGAAHLAGVTAAHTLLPVLGVPMESASLKGLDSLLSTVQMPGGIPVGTLAIGKPGATNAALLAVAILANKRPELREKLRQYRAEQAEKIRGEKLE
jgi:5-(carboxyamino)imidazole ribonucleotide mutase